MKEYLFLLLGYKKEFRFIHFLSFLQLRFCQKVLGFNFKVPWPVHVSSIVSSYQNIKYKKEVTPLGYSANSYIQAMNGIVVGSNVIHATGLTIISASHDVSDFRRHVVSSPVIIGDNCWLGANVTILPGVRLGNHVIVAAGSVVTKSFVDDDCIIAGVPARVIKRISPYNGKHYFLDNYYIKNNVIFKE